MARRHEWAILFSKNKPRRPLYCGRVPRVTPTLAWFCPIPPAGLRAKPPVLVSKKRLEFYRTAAGMAAGFGIEEGSVPSNIVLGIVTEYPGTARYLASQPRPKP